MLPSFDFAAQYALLSKFNNYDVYYNAFQRNNATIGVSIVFPFLNYSQRARANGADAEALKAKKQAEAVRNQVSEDTLKLQRSRWPNSLRQETWRTWNMKWRNPGSMLHRAALLLIRQPFTNWTMRAHRLQSVTWQRRTQLSS